MSSWPSPSALDASTRAFPILNAVQIGRLRPGSKLRKVEPGEILFQQKIAPDVSPGKAANEIEVLRRAPAGFGRERLHMRLKNSGSCHGLTLVVPQNVSRALAPE
jgi:hypothetical protein